MARAITVDIPPTAIPGTSPGARRRTWLSNGQDETDAVTLTGAALPEERVARGRTLASDSGAPRRSSLPNIDGLSETPDDTVMQPDDAGDEAQFLSPAPPKRRSSSQRSQPTSSRAASLSSSHAGDLSDDASDSQMTNYRPKSPASGSSRQLSTSPATTFFQTLKSRAGDKQALSNTAKETMRKWGVSWGNFRRDTMGSNGSGPSAAPADEVPDAGHGDQRRPDSGTSTVRPSYAEVRAAVEERRERERAPAQEHSSQSNGAVESIPVPPSAKGKHRAESASPDNAPAETYPASTGTAKPGMSARDESPAPLERTDSQASASSHHSASHVFGIPPAEDQRPPSTIHTQPPAPKTMSIPGIHASHRGEVMSMGYAPPPPAAPQEPKKAPLQSVYRLWKNPASDSATSATSTRSEPAPVSQTGFTGRDQDSASPPTSEGDVVAPSASPQPLRPVPPPLPPRAASTNVHSKPEVARSREPDASPSFNSMSRASAALQSIASKDREKRASLTPPSTVPSSPGQEQDRDGSNLSGAESSTPSQEESGLLDRSEQEVSSPPSSSASVTPTPSHPSSPPPAAAPNGRGPPPALPPRRLRATA